MKTLLSLTIVILLLTSCTPQKEYPKYSIGTASITPDSLKEKQRAFVTETVRAASQHMTGGDYEDVDETIEAAEWASRRLFEVDMPCLIIEQTEYGYVKIVEKDLTPSQKAIYDRLSLQH